MLILPNQLKLAMAAFGITGCFKCKSAGQCMHQIAGLVPSNISAEHRRLCKSTCLPAIITDDASSSSLGIIGHALAYSLTESISQTKSGWAIHEASAPAICFLHMSSGQYMRVQQMHAIMCRGCQRSNGCKPTVLCAALIICGVKFSQSSCARAWNSEKFAIMSRPQAGDCFRGTIVHKCNNVCKYFW